MFSNKNLNLPNLGIDTNFQDIDKLQEALENQIDIVLRLEEERLSLLKENKQQKQIIENLTSKNQYNCAMNLGKTEEVQVEFQVEKKDEMIQTGEEKESSKNELLEEAMMLVNKHNNKLKTSCFNGSETNRESQKSKQSALKTKRTATQSSFLKENDSVSLNTNPQQKVSEKDLLVQEIVKLTKENNTFKFQMRTFAETNKILVKENSELKKNCEVKSEALEKLRKEISELSKVLNTDKFKSIKNIENDLHKALSLNKSLQNEVILKNKENSIMQEDLENLKHIIEKLSKNYENSEERNLHESQMEMEKTLKNKDKILEELKQNLKFKEEQLNMKDESLKEMSIQNESLSDEVEYFKNIAKTSKNHADKALNDLEFYRTKLLEMQAMKNSDN